MRGPFEVRLGRLGHYPPRPLRPDPVDADAPLSSGRLPISLVTPVFNQVRYVDATMDSVLTQGYPALEYIVIDGGSRDGTAERVRARSNRLAHFESGPDGGQADAINRGMRHATGNVLGWLNADDLLLPGALDRVAAVFEQRPEVDVIYGNRILIDAEGSETGRWVLPPHSSRVLSWCDFIPQETLFWRRAIWERVGGRVDESFHFAMDWDLLVRFRDAGARFLRVPRFLGAFRVHEQQKTQAEMGSAGVAEMARIRMRCLGRVPTDRECRNAAIPYLLLHVLWDRAERLRRRLG